jgi:hypothetical protein
MIVSLVKTALSGNPANAVEPVLSRKSQAPMPTCLGEYHKWRWSI